MAEQVIDVRNRVEFGGNVSRRIRASGMIPAIVYGQGKETIAISVDPRSIEEIRRSSGGQNTIIRLNMVEGEQVFKLHMMLKEVQVDPVTEELLHVDFYRLDMSKSIEVRVPVRLEGESLGVKEEGGMLDFINRELNISCLPDNIPDFIQADIGELMVGDNLRVKDVEVAEGVTILDKEEMVLMVIHAPKLPEEEEPEEELEEEAAAEEEEKDATTEKGGEKAAE